MPVTHPQINDMNGDRKGSGHISLRPNADGTIPFQIGCMAGTYLRGTAVDDVAVEARIVGDVSWINLETTPIDLTPYDDTFQDFELRFTDARGDTLRGRRLFRLFIDSGDGLTPGEGAVYNDSEDEIYNDTEDLVYAGV